MATAGMWGSHHTPNSTKCRLNNLCPGIVGVVFTIMCPLWWKGPGRWGTQKSFIWGTPLRDPTYSFIYYFWQKMYPFCLKWNLVVIKGQGAGIICSLQHGFVKSRLFSIYFTTTGTHNIVCYTEDFIKIQYRALLYPGSTIPSIDNWYPFHIRS